MFIYLFIYFYNFLNKNIFIIESDLIYQENDIDYRYKDGRFPVLASYCVTNAKPRLLYSNETVG
jgi:hypothetical protein